ncbi:unnamed protein product [Nezara viridula]|uniref:Gustatory receptor n=1 Tax=Nezara viridula TaxID=85310 RepID=A0A9P0HII6_NEZVI|nr:unnamed protein product [Nezara viridula]
MFSKGYKLFSSHTIFGMNQLYYDKKLKIMKNSKIRIMYSFLLVAIQSFATIQETTSADNIKSEKSIILYRIDNICVGLTCVTGILLSCYFGEKIMKILRKMNKIKLMLIKNKDEDYFYILLKLFLVGQFVVIIYDQYVWYCVNREIEFSSITFSFCYLIIAMMHIKFTDIVMNIATHFKSLNDVLLRNLENLFGGKSKLNNTLNPRKGDVVQLLNLSKLIENYQTLCNVIEEINQRNSSQNLILVIYCFEQLICGPYYGFMNSLMFEKSNLGYHFVVSNCLWTLHEICRLLIFLWPCSYLEKQALATRKLLSEYLDPSKHNYCGELEIHILKVTHSFKPLNVLQLFPLNLSLAVQVFGAATTYLVIFIQI